MNTVLYVIIFTIVLNLIGNLIWKYIPKTKKGVDLWISFALISICVLLLINNKENLNPISDFYKKTATDTIKQPEQQQTPKKNESFDSTNISSTESQKKLIVKIQQENKKRIAEINSDNHIRQQSTSIKLDSDLDNIVQHKGYLTIKVLENSLPIPFIDYYISCEKEKHQGSNDRKVLSQEIFIGEYNGTGFINCKINNDRWLLDKWKDELKMPNTVIEINGKIIPDRYIIISNNEESANYRIKLERIE